MKSKLKITAISILFAISSSAFAAEPITALYQPGLAYFPIMHMEHAKLYEKHAALKAAETKIEYRQVAGPGNIVDGLLSKAAVLGSMGAPSVPLLVAKTDGKFKVMDGLAYMPMFLNSSNPNVKTLADFLKPENEGKNKMAVPTPKTSVQAVMLQMAAANTFGIAKYDILDKLTVAMKHPDATASMLSFKTEINNHFTSVPFQEQELRDGKGKIHKVVSSYDVMGGKSSFVVQMASVEWAQKNPKEFQAFKDAYEESITWINSHKAEAAKEYVELSKSKDTPAAILELLNDPDIEFNLKPIGLTKVSNFMASVKTIKFAPTYNQMTFDHLHGKNGN